ncbi:MAG: 50S ribosomal protein L4 [archaeon]|nr:MAG: 50S ribosomal protein L4 [archaeon]
MVNVLDLQGKVKEKMELPKVFSTPYRSDLIRRAVIAAQANRRQKYGSDRMAGKRTSAHYHGLTHADPDQRMMGREMSRMPREHGDTARFMRGRLSPHAVGGRRAHPPKVAKKWDKKINKKEKIFAIKSAIAGTAKKELVMERSHFFEGLLPVVVEDSVQEMKKIGEVKDFLKRIGMEKEMERVGQKKARSGRGKLRRGKYKKRTGPLIVIKEDKGIVKACRNIPGLDVVEVGKIDAEKLSPGAHGIRLTIWSKSAMESLEPKKV